MSTGDHTHMLGSVTQFLDAGDMRQFFELRDARQLDRTKARSTVAFDLTFAIVTLLSVVGLWLDIWSHVTYGADQSIFSQYHLLFYSATVMAGLFLAYTGISNLQAGYRWSDAFAGWLQPLTGGRHLLRCGRLYRPDDSCHLGL